MSYLFVFSITITKFLFIKTESKKDAKKCFSYFFKIFDYILNYIILYYIYIYLINIFYYNQMNIFISYKYLYIW